VHPEDSRPFPHRISLPGEGGEGAARGSHDIGTLRSVGLGCFPEFAPLSGRGPWACLAEVVLSLRRGGGWVKEYVFDDFRGENQFIHIFDENRYHPLQI